jgi:hypothetical protein
VVEETGDDPCFRSTGKWRQRTEQVARAGDVTDFLEVTSIILYFHFKIIVCRTWQARTMMTLLSFESTKLSIGDMSSLIN